MTLKTVLYQKWSRHLVLLTVCLMPFGSFVYSVPVIAEENASPSASNSVSTLSDVPTVTQNVYVSPKGSDYLGAGTFQAPYRTLPKVRSVLRDTYAERPEGGTTVWLREGEYELSSTLELNELDSGTADRPVTYRNYPNEQAVITTARTIDPTLWQPLNPEAAARVNPAVYADQLIELDVQSLGLKNTSGFPGGTTFTKEWGIADLIVDGVREPISQWPNPQQKIGKNRVGWVTMNGSADPQSFYYGEGGQPKDGITTDEVNADQTDRTARWQRSIEQGHDLYLKGFWRTDFDPVTSKVESIDNTRHIIRLVDMPEGGIGSKWSKEVPIADSTPAISSTASSVNFPAPSPVTIHNDTYVTQDVYVAHDVYTQPSVPVSPPTVTSVTYQVYRVGTGTEEWQALNLLDEIDMPGEWALDFKDQKIYYYPDGDISKQNIIIADRTGPIIKLTNTSYLNFVGLTIEGGLNNGIEMQNSHHILLDNNTIRNIGGGGILDYYGHHNIIQNNTIYETGSFGISIGYAGNRDTLIPAQSVITNNHIHHTGTLIALEGLIITQSIGMTISHNLIHDVPKHGIRYVYNNDLLFEYNELHHISLEDGDAGAFYTAQDWTSYGNVLRYNYVHDSPRANGFYADDGDSGDTFTNNIVSGVSKAFLFGGGHHNRATGNVIVNATSGIQIDDRGIARKYTADSTHAEQLIAKQPLAEPWKSYGRVLADTYGYDTNLWKNILNPKWHPEYPNGTHFKDNAVVQSGALVIPKKGAVVIQNNPRISSMQSAGLNPNTTNGIYTQNPTILAIFPTINQIYPQIGLQKDNTTSVTATSD
ncbi:right-handed parallel beta-helix repeat-containing protein [Paenibacillus nicotianae]|uniref:Right-handed parallel beta-helix repeat-containing protein n=1 Tax=Paenibacillus nicotianae TaxID=1526551 RepID=A0ABW4USL1_9BACL